MSDLGTPEHWRELQRAGYFKRHPCYHGGENWTSDSVFKVNRALSLAYRQPLSRTSVGMVIGCGYGRESVELCHSIGLLYGVDVDSDLLALTTKNLLERGCGNFVPVLCDRWADSVRLPLDFAYSINVFQHVPDSIVIEYLRGLRSKMKHNGVAMIQFTEGPGNSDALEPHFSRTSTEVTNLIKAGALEVSVIVDEDMQGIAVWHWVVAVIPSYSA